MSDYSNSFLAAWAHTIAFETSGDPEGGYSNDPDDPGGETRWGISKRYNPEIDIKNLTEMGAKAIAHRNIWCPLLLDRVDRPPIAIEMFDTAFNQGNAMAVQIAQGALILLGQDLSLDGRIGKQTVAALNRYPYIVALLKTMNALQFMAYTLGSGNVEEIVSMVGKRKAHVQRYLRGWLKRVELAG